MADGLNLQVVPDAKDDDDNNDDDANAVLIETINEEKKERVIYNAGPGRSLLIIIPNKTDVGKFELRRARWG